jgi:hypothetical protein
LDAPARCQVGECRSWWSRILNSNLSCSCAQLTMAARFAALIETVCAMHGLGGADRHDSR